MKTIINATMVLGSVVFLTMSFSAFSPTQDEWEVPEEYKTLENKYADADDEDGIGEELYAKHCKSCHGKEGYGDGKKANELETEMRDLTLEEVQSQTDGELYYKSIIGRDEMPNFEKKIRDEEDQWLVVNYVRSLEE